MIQHSTKDVDLRYCFVEHTGNVWKTSTLIRESGPLRAHRFYLNQVSSKHPLAWHVNNVSNILAHLNRIHNADMSMPIILRADGCIMNGLHRVVRALYEGRNYVLAKQFIKNPKPDFVLPTDHPAVLRV